MRAGTIIELADGRHATLVYHFLDGYGVAFGKHALNPNDESEWPQKEAMLDDIGEYKVVWTPQPTPLTEGKNGEA